ncbi:MAG: sensor histidine kinase [Chthoniobacteraceae bacterium]|jgi:signal transduction histidine kinase
MTFSEYCRSRSKITLMVMAVLGVLTVGFVDYITGYEISFFLFYGGPILFSVWFLDRKSTVFIVLLSAIVWWWADWADGHPYFASWVQIWETIVRLAFFSFVAFSGMVIKSRRESLETLVTNLRRLRELEHDIVAASEHEQQRIGADLHDGLCQYLAGIACMTGSLRDDLCEGFQPEAETAAELHELMKDAIVQARNIARGIAPVHMDEAGLVSALEELAATMRRHQAINCKFESAGEVMISDREAAIHLYRIAQEATSNAVRHGLATNVLIRLAVEEGEIVLTIRDNGSGIGEAAGSKNGMGLRSMRYRADVLNGNLEVSALAEGGTCVQCRAPLGVKDSIHAN